MTTSNKSTSTGWNGGTTGDITTYTGITNNRSDSDGWIQVKGYGRLTYGELEDLVEKGKIIEKYNANTGKYSYTTK